MVTGAGLYLALYIDRPLIFPLTAICLALFWAYHFPPLQLEMRGGGEILQALGFGLLLPLIGYYAQTGNWRPLPQTLLMPYIILQLAAAPLHHRLDDSFFHQCVFKKIVFSAGYIYALGFNLAQLWN